MLEILNFPKERFLYLIPYTPIKYTLYSLPIYNLRYPIFKYTKSPVQMKIQFRTTSYLTTRRNIPEPTPPPQELRSKIAFGKNKTYFCQDKTPIMLKAGRTQTLTVNRISDYGLYLIDDEQNEVLLPNRYVSLANKVGDTLEVFVYHDSEDRLVATTETPKLREGEAGFLRVVDKNLHGAFLDWGLAGKDLFLPNRNQQGGVLAGRNCLVYLYVDSVTGRCVATMKFKSYVNNDVITVKPREEVSLLVASESPIGYRVIVNNRHWGMIYRNQLFRRIDVGDRLKGYVTRITEDNRIDVSLQQQGVAEVRHSAETLLSMIHENGGSLPLNDDSDPAEIAARTQMSKKVFKRSLGMLLKRGAVEITQNGVKLTGHNG